MAPLPQVEFPTIQVHAGLPGASPETMASVRGHAARAAIRPHRRRHRDDVDQHARLDIITLQFDLNRNIDAAARDVQAAINAAAGQLPADLPAMPTYARSIRPIRPS